MRAATAIVRAEKIQVSLKSKTVCQLELQINSSLVGQIAFKQGTTTRMTTSKQYDYLNRLTQISSAPSAAYTQSLTFNYSYNSANQRIKDTLADGSYWVYGYDSLGQVTNGLKYFANGTPVAGQQFDYAFDTIGNRTQTQAGGDLNGANLRVANYSVNNLNQITSRDVPGYADVMGASILTNAVTVNGQTAYRNQEYFRQQIGVTNVSKPVWTNITVAGGATVSGNVFVAETPEHFSYDADGNLTNDGRWTYIWDGENRLIQMSVKTNIGPQYQLNFAYDYQGRRIQKMVSTNGIGIYTNDFLYDDWNLVATLNPQSSILASFVWGIDLSGSPQGAGGVGGLLEMSQFGASTTNCFPAFDGNGNVMALVNAADGTFAAEYDYGPFGEPIRIDGSMGTANPLRFSTKYDDDESDLLYYGYRYYKPSKGAWISKDPIGEWGGRNVYGFAQNSAINIIDSKGLCGCRCKTVKYGVPSNTINVSHPVNVAPPPYTVGISVPYTIEVTGGDPTKCHCMYYDDGSISATLKYRDGEVISSSTNYQHVVTEIPCQSGNDSPGIEVTTVSPVDNGFSAYATMNYNWTGTLVCQDGHGTSFDEATLDETDSGPVNSPNRSQ